jgi:hypothetical protein
LPAKFHLLELPVMVVLNMILIPLAGIAGAAITWSLRVVFDGILLFGGVARTRAEEAREAGALLLWRGLAGQFAFGVILAVGISLVESLPVRLALAAGYLGIHGILAWKNGLDNTDKLMMGSVARNLLQGRA